jgi:Transposase protein
LLQLYQAGLFPREVRERFDIVSWHPRGVGESTAVRCFDSAEEAIAWEAKHLTDTIKMVAYRAQTALVRCLAPHYARTDDEGRALLREMLSSSVDVLPDAQHLRIRLHSQANPRSNQALAHVCATLNALELQYPGTSLTGL